MSDKNAPVISVIPGVQVKIGQFTADLVSVTTPARERKLSDGSVKQVAEKIILRCGFLSPQQAVSFLSAALGAAEAANAGDGAKLAEKILGRHFENAFEEGCVVGADGQPGFSDEAYSKALYSIRKTRSTTTLEDLRSQHSVLLAQAVALSEVRDDWSQAALGLNVDENGDVVGHPWTAEVWAERCLALSKNDNLAFGAIRFDSFHSLTTVILTLRDRRRALEQQMSEREAQRRIAAEKRKDTKAKKAAAPTAADGADSAPAA